jgi:thiamine biosynthesis lipoprotein
MALDFGGFGKEWAVDIVAQIARDHGLTAALVDFGHDLRAVGLPSGRPAWHIGLEDPAAPGALKGSLALTRGQGVASSGDYLRRVVIDGVRYGHIVDPRTGLGATDLAQVTVVGPLDCAVDALSTALSLCGGHADAADEIARILRRFPGYRARVEHAGVARWLP